MVSELNQIERSTLVRAPRSRVWRALTDIAEFCRWFQAETAATAFEPGAHLLMASTYPGPCYKQTFYLDVVDMIPEQIFSWRWHPGANLDGVDLSQEPPTLVTFRLEDAEGGTRVTVTESGFDQIFANRRPQALSDNNEGWKIQLEAFARYLHDAA